MKLKKHGAFLVDFMISYADGEMSRQDFDLDYSGYVIEHFGAFETENPRLAAKFARTVDAAYSNFSWMVDDAFRQAISDAIDDFLGTAKISDIY
jgi:hypothetical protein